jgi:hypothetical protein
MTGADPQDSWGENSSRNRKSLACFIGPHYSHNSSTIVNLSNKEENMYIIAHAGSLVLLEKEDEAITRAKCFAADSGQPLVVYKITAVRTIENPEPALEPRAM